MLFRSSMMLMVGCPDGLVSSTQDVRPPTVQSDPSLGFPCAHEYPCHGGLACSGSKISGRAPKGRWHVWGQTAWCWGSCRAHNAAAMACRGAWQRAGNPPKGCFIFSYTMGVGGGGPNCCATDIRSLPLARWGTSMGQWGWHAAAPWACPTSMMLMVGCPDGLVSSTEDVRPPTVQSAPSLGFPCAQEYPCHGGLACSGSKISGRPPKGRWHVWGQTAWCWGSCRAHNAAAMACRGAWQRAGNPPPQRMLHFLLHHGCWGRWA